MLGLFLMKNILKSFYYLFLFYGYASKPNLSDIFRARAYTIIDVRNLN